MKIHASMSLGGGGDRTSCPLRVAICRAVGARWRPSAAGRLPDVSTARRALAGFPGDRDEAGRVRGWGRPLAGFRRGWRPPLSRGQAWRGRGLKRPWTGRCERRARALFLNVLNVYHRSAHF
jgi:hypothetical protein